VEPVCRDAEDDWLSDFEVGDHSAVRVEAAAGVVGCLVTWYGRVSVTPEWYRSTPVPPRGPRIGRCTPGTASAGEPEHPYDGVCSLASTPDGGLVLADSTARGTAVLVLRTDSDETQSGNAFCADRASGRA